MQQIRAYLLIGCLAVAGIFLAPQAKADQFDQKTTITFSGPVELPGISLPAGTYVFRLVDPAADENIVQVLSADEQKTLGVIRAIPDYRLHVTDTTVIRFEERAAGAPKAIKEWFFPDNHYGQEFIYPKTNSIHSVRMAANAKSHAPA